jgi:hypothetical protein
MIKIKKTVIFWLGLIILVFALLTLFGISWMAVITGVQFKWLVQGPYIPLLVGCIAFSIIGICMMLSEREF